jgi:hypothetical protein
MKEGFEMNESLITPRQAVRKHCIDCVGRASEVRNCGGNGLWNTNGSTYECMFYKYRMGKGRPTVKLIHNFCIWCIGTGERAVERCPSKTCPFLPYRMGRNPNKAHFKGRFVSSETPSHLRCGDEDRRSENERVVAKEASERVDK